MLKFIQDIDLKVQKYGPRTLKKESLYINVEVLVELEPKLTNTAFFFICPQII